MAPAPGRERPGRDGVEGLPLTLLVTMVVLAITIPLVFSSLRAYDRGRVEALVISEIDDFISSVQSIYISGPGNSVLVDFDLSAGAMTGIDYVMFGDSPGGNLSSVIRYKLNDAPEKLLAIVSPNVPMTSNESAALVIMPGANSIKAECASVASPEGTRAYVVLKLVH